MTIPNAQKLSTKLTSRSRIETSQRMRIASISDHIEMDGAAPLEIQQPLETIRTDLDAFDDVEIEELVRHGYYCAQKSIGIEASIRVVVPKDLNFRNLKTLNYLSGTAAQADTRAGTTVSNAEQTDLVWIIEHPTIGWTYGLQWTW